MSDDSNDALFDELVGRFNDLELASSPVSPPNIEAVADQLAQHYGHVVVMVTEKDPDQPEATLYYAWRGGYYAARGMLSQMQDIMKMCDTLHSRDESDDE